MASLSCYKFLDIIRLQAEEGFIEIIGVNDEVLKEARKILEKFSDHPLTLANATSAAILKLKRFPHIATFDHHFRIMRFPSLP